MVGNGRVGLVLICALIGAICLPAGAQYGGGSGTADDPYLIYTAVDMVAFAGAKEDQDKRFRLMEDIDLGAYTGTDYPNLCINWGGEFSGVFDGNGKTISNFTYTCADVNCVGLFGIIGLSGAVFDLGLIDPNIVAAGSDYVGALAGMCLGAVTNCYVKNASVSAMDYVGCLFGSTGSEPITDCHASGTVTGSLMVGGLAGYVWAPVTRCSAVVEVSGGYDVGGLIGWNNGWVSECCSRGSVVGDTFAGGLIGSNGVEISNCYSVCDVNALDRGGGLAGYASPASATINSYSAGKVEAVFRPGGLLAIEQTPHSELPISVQACFWDTQTSGRITSGGGTGLSTAQMQTLATFLDAGWDFTGETANGVHDLWQMPEGHRYPRLSWEEVPVDDPNDPNDPNASPFGPPWVDDFEDDGPEPLWSFWQSDGDTANLVEIDGVLGVQTSGWFNRPAALYVSKGWMLDTTEDFSLKVAYYLAPEGIGQGWVSIGLTTDPLDPLVQFVDVAATYVDGESLYKVRQNNENVHRTWWDDRPGETGTLYLSYDAGKDELYQSGTGFGADEAWNTISGLIGGQWQNAPVHIIVGGGNFGPMILTEKEAWLDNFSVESGMTTW